MENQEIEINKLYYALSKINDQNEFVEKYVSAEQRVRCGLFNKAKKEYERCRDGEKDYIVSQLEAHGIKVEKDNNKEEVYNEIDSEKPYDLSNWLVIKVSLGDKRFYISLQAFDQDTDSKNYHVLMDRIGIYPVLDGELKIDLKKVGNINKKQTRIELPMDEDELADLMGELKEFLDIELNYKKLKKRNREDIEKFSDAKKMYKRCREGERKYIISALRTKKFKERGIIVPKAKGGKQDQKCPTIYKDYDISNWKYIYVIVDNKIAFFISFQAFDKDKNSNNYHILMDRVGVYMHHEDVFRKYIASQSLTDLKTPNALEEMKITDVDLPIDEKKLERLEQFLLTEMTKKHLDDAKDLIDRIYMLT